MDQRMSLRPRGAVLLLIVACTTFLGAAPIAAQDATPAAAEVTAIAPDEPYAGATLAEWSARASQWFLSFPLDAHPGMDATGASCGHGQHGPVFFLPPSLSPEAGTLTCVVPAGMAVLVPLGGVGCTTVEPPPYFGRDEAELRACAEAGADDFSELTVSVNGEPIADVDQYRTTTPLYTINLPEDNVLGVPAGVAEGVSAGYDLLLAPLPPGEYLIEGGGQVDLEGDVITFGGAYTVIVEAPQVVEPAATPDTGTPAATPTG